MEIRGYAMGAGASLRHMVEFDVALGSWVMVVNAHAQYQGPQGRRGVVVGFERTSGKPARRALVLFEGFNRSSWAPVSKLWPCASVALQSRTVRRRAPGGELLSQLVGAVPLPLFVHADRRAAA